MARAAREVILNATERRSMAMFDLIFIGLLCTGVSLLVMSVIYTADRRILAASSTFVPSLLLLAPTFNSAATLPILSRLHAPGLQRQVCRLADPLHAYPTVGRSGLEQPGDSRCSIEFVVNPSSSAQPLDPVRSRLLPDVPVPSARCWAKGPARANCYSLATLEFDRTGAMRDARQLNAISNEVRRLKAQLPNPTSDPSQVYLIAFVHGWRHDAHVTDANVARLRVIASNAAQNIAERCQTENKYCNTAVVGLYVGWPGSLGLWDNRRCPNADDHTAAVMDDDVPVAGNDCWQSYLGAYLNALTFPKTKVTSDDVGAGMVRTLSLVRNVLENTFGKEPDTGSHRLSNRFHMLVIGHSLGGNALLTGVAGIAPSSDGRIGPGDLTVLINPATETTKWIALVDRTNGAWPATTPPRFMFLAGPATYYSKRDLLSCAGRSGDPICTSRLAQQAIIKVENDSVVETWFRASQLVTTWPWTARAARVGLGHLDIDDPAWSGREPRRYYTHFAELNKTGDYRPIVTNYADVGVDRNICMVEPGFIEAARTGWLPSGHGARPALPNAKWDFRDVEQTGTLGRIIDIQTTAYPVPNAELAKGLPQACANGGKLRTRQQMNLQFGTGLVPSPSARAEHVGPVWGVRVNGSTFYGHGGFASAPLLCMLNKIVLDDPMATADPDRYVRRVDHGAFETTMVAPCKTAAKAADRRVAKTPTSGSPS